MSILFIATQPEEVRNLLPWAVNLAAAERDELIVLLCQRRKGDSRLVEVAADSDDDDSELVSQARITRDNLQASAISDCDSSEGTTQTIELHQFLGENWAKDIANQMETLKPMLIILPAPVISKDQAAADNWQTELSNGVDCDVMMVQDDSHGVNHPLQPAVFVTDGTDDEAAFRYALQLVEHCGGAVTAVYVQPNVTQDAASLGRRHLDSMINRLVRSGHRDQIRRRVIVADNTSSAIESLTSREFDILIMGTRDRRRMRRFFDSAPATESSESSPIPAVATLRCGESLGSRLKNKADRFLRQIVPQLSREDRVNLVSRVHESSKWDFDFVFLVSLSTLIACLGLAENSVAVVVGAMLVAPLMTPIAGVGLGVAHANAYLTKVAFRTAIRGFATAIFIGLLFGFCVQAGHQIGWLDSLQQLSSADDPASPLVFLSEMEGRTRPQFYDLLIALLSGVAAAYAMGRPNLFSALPGVAIAAALVPPVATSGIAIAHGELIKGGGAILLFVTNMVTIILGASLIFRAVGIKTQKEGPNAAQWPRYVLLLLVVLSVMITILIEMNHQNSQ